MSSLDGDSVEMNCSLQGVLCTEAQLSRYHCGGAVTFAFESRQMDFSDSLSLHSTALAACAVSLLSRAAFAFPSAEPSQAFPALVWRQTTQSCLKCMPPQDQHPPAFFKYSPFPPSSLSRALELPFPFCPLYPPPRPRFAN